MVNDIISLGGTRIGKRKEGSFFIVVEGLAGSGKTPQAKLIADALKEKGKQTILTIEPTKTSKVSKRIAEALAKKYKIKLEELQKLFSEDRKEHVEKLIIPAIKKGRVVVSDRYAFTTFSYGSLGSNLEELYELNKKFPLPDLTIFVDVAPKECLKRIGGRGKSRELFEGIEELKANRSGYKKIFKKFPNVQIIDGSGTIQETHKKIMREVNRLVS